jgi:hypothetical protein
MPSLQRHASDLTTSNKDCEALSGHVWKVRPIITAENWIGHQFGTPRGDAFTVQSVCTVLYVHQVGSARASGEGCPIA